MTKIIQKRYQHYTKDGIKWTEWFNHKGSSQEPWQLKGKLKNQYRTIEV